jgi:hypothetical protein
LTSEKYLPSGSRRKVSFASEERILPARCQAIDGSLGLIIEVVGDTFGHWVLAFLSLVKALK